MSALVVWVLTAYVALVVVLTRVLLGRRGRGGRRAQVAPVTLAAHTAVGSLGLVLWLLFLVLPDDVTGSALVGVLGLGCWWVLAVLGLVLLVRWIPSSGRRSAGRDETGWLQRPWLSLVGHLGVAVATVVFSAAYVFAWV